jgi:hypothetical protein
MRVPHLRLAALALVSGVALGGCAYGLGDPYGYSPYGGVSVGYGSGYGYGYDPYYSGYGYGSYGGYGGYGYGGFGSPFGWYNNYYYPGSGFYVYDRHHRSRRMTDAERHYWQWRQNGSRSGSGPMSRAIQQWSDRNSGVQVQTSTGSTTRSTGTVTTTESVTPRSSTIRGSRERARSRGDGEGRRGGRHHNED